MKTLLWIETTLVTALAAGCILKLVLLGFQMAMNPEERNSYTQEIKRVIIVAAISTVVSSGSILVLASQYLKD